MESLNRYYNVSTVQVIVVATSTIDSLLNGIKLVEMNGILLIIV